jgi:hypothetical protein
MTILTALAVYTIGLICGIFVVYYGLKRVYDTILVNGSLKLLEAHECHEDHVHAIVEFGGHRVHVVLQKARTDQVATAPEA